MQSVIHYVINDEYAKVRIESLIDWEKFLSIAADIFDNISMKGGRPNIDEVVMIKMLVQWYGTGYLSDPELERQATVRISFRKFLELPNVISNKSTIWTFRKRLIERGKEIDKKRLKP